MMKCGLVLVKRVGSSLGEEMGNLRNDHGCYGEIVGAGCVETSGQLLGCRLAVMLDMSVFEIAVERVEV